MSETTGREPLERDKRGRRILKHDRGGYSRGCRCPGCTADHTVYVGELRHAIREAAGRWVPEAEVRKLHRTVSLSELDIALIDQVRKEDAPMSAWLREAALEKVSRILGTPVEDTARRPAPRRRNYSEQQREDEGR